MLFRSKYIINKEFINGTMPSELAEKIGRVLFYIAARPKLTPLTKTERAIAFAFETNIKRRSQLSSEAILRLDPEGKAMRQTIEILKRNPSTSDLTVQDLNWIRGVKRALDRDGIDSITPDAVEMVRLAGKLGLL